MKSPEATQPAIPGGGDQVRARRRAYPKVLPKFRNPDEPSQPWTGRGKQPRSLTAQIRLGKTDRGFSNSEPACVIEYQLRLDPSSVAIFGDKHLTPNLLPALADSVRSATQEEAQLKFSNDYFDRLSRFDFLPVRLRLLRCFVPTRRRSTLTLSAWRTRRRSAKSS